jgi:hypothetical protein
MGYSTDKASLMGKGGTGYLTQLIGTGNFIVAVADNRF